MPRGKKKDSALYCVCHRPDDGERSMIGCDHCGNWFHYECLGLKPSDVPEGEWFCRSCCALKKSHELLKMDLSNLFQNSCELKLKNECQGKATEILQLQAELHQAHTVNADLKLDIEKLKVLENEKAVQCQRKDEEVCQLVAKLKQVDLVNGELSHDIEVLKLQQNDKDMSIASLNLRVTELDGKSCAIDEDILSLQRDLCQMHSVTENLMQEVNDLKNGNQRNDSASNDSSSFNHAKIRELELEIEGLKTQLSSERKKRRLSLRKDH